MTTKDKENKDFVIETPGFRVNYKFLRLRTSFNGLLRNRSVRTGRDRWRHAYPLYSTPLYPGKLNNTAALLEMSCRISLYVTDDAIAKLYVT